MKDNNKSHRFTDRYSSSHEKEWVPERPQVGDSAKED